MLRIPKKHIFRSAVRVKSRDFRVDYIVLALERIEVEMAALGNVSVMALFPATLLLLTMEIVLASYKSLSPKWTTKLAFGNLIINVAWTILIVVLLLNPSIVIPHIAGVLADMFQRSPDEIITQVHLIVMVIGLASIATTIIDAFSGFKKLRSDNNEVNEATRE